jgi:hypothetical protein
LNPTDELAAAAAAWVTEVGHRLDAQHGELMNACVNAAETDLRIVIRLKEGLILLEGTNIEAGQCVEIYREQVEPLRPVASH